MPIITAHINHVERSVSQGFKPLTFKQFKALTDKINAAPAIPRGWDKV